MADVEFGTSDVSALLAEMDNEESTGKAMSLYWTPKNEGTTAIRFLPQLKTFNEKLFYQKHRIHWVGGKSYYCLNQTLVDKDGNLHEAESCPFCTKSKQLYNSSERGSEEWSLAGELRAKDRYASRIIVRGKKDKDGNDTEFKPEFYEFGSKIHEMIKQTLVLGECGDVFSLKEGRDFNLSKKGVKKNTDYSGSTFSMKQSPIFTDVTKLKALMAELPKMEYKQLVTFETKETLENVLKEYLGESKEEVSFKSSETISDDDIFGVAKEIVKEEPKEESNPDEDLDALLNSI